MASITKTRTVPTRSRQRGAAPRLGPVAALRARLDAVQAALPSFAGSPRLRREILGVALVVVAVLTAAVLGRGGDEGRLVAWWGEVLTDSFGRAAPLVPLLTGLAAIRALGSQPGPILEARHLLGGFLFAVAVVGLLQLGAGPTDPTAGGYLGLAVATLSTRLLGQLGAGLALFVAGVFAVFLLAGSDLQTFWADLRALLGLVGRALGAVLAAVAAVVGAAAAMLHRRASHPIAPGDTGAVPGEPPARRRADRLGGAGPPLWETSSKPVGSSKTATSRFVVASAASAAPKVANAVEPTTATAADEAAAGLLPPAVAVAPDPEPVPEQAPLPTIAVPARPPRLSWTGKAGEEAAGATGLDPLPELDRLTYYDAVEPDSQDLHRRARLIEETLASFRVEARVREINPGPAVTQFALEPGNGVKVRRITELQNDLALALAAPSIRIEAPIPGLARVGVEIPNDQIATVGLRETLEAPAFARSKAKLPIPLGRDVNGRYVVGDLTRMPHLLIAGATGAGKSVCLNCIISTFLLTRRPEELKLLMIDPKMVELTGYNGVPHLQCPVVTEMDKVVGALRLVLREMERRYALFSQHGVRNLDGYRMKIADEPGAERLPYLVVIIDELADLMMTAPDEVETLLVRLCQMARATGIHLIIATQRPSVDVVTGLIKANVPSRIAFAVSSLADSRVVLDLPGAERLLGRGDMLYLPADAAKPVRIQGAFLDDKDVQHIVEHWHAVAPVPRYEPEWLDLPSSDKGGAAAGGDFGEDGDDPLFEDALRIVKQQGTASASMLQRRLRVGYNRAARLIERMEDEGMIGPADGVRGRPVLFGAD